MCVPRVRTPPAGYEMFCSIPRAEMAGRSRYKLSFSHVDDPMKSFLESSNANPTSAYRQVPSLIKEHHGIEQTVLAGGYGYRQIIELVQNGADAKSRTHVRPLEEPAEFMFCLGIPDFTFPHRAGLATTSRQRPRRQ
jgi:hypothetical protein